MAHESLILSLMEALKVADDKIIGDIMSAKKIWSSGQSARTNALKALKNLSDLRKIERCDGYFRTFDCKSEYGEHSRLLTKALAEILKLNISTAIYREHTIREIGLRPDAICFLTNDNQGLCFILEVVHNETPDYLRQKISAWQSWNGATEYLSNLFSHEIPAISFVTVGTQYHFPELVTFDNLLTGVKHEINRSKESFQEVTSRP